MANDKETKLEERAGPAVTMSVEDWMVVYNSVSRDYPDIARAIILELQESLEGYEGRGPTVELFADECRAVLALMEDLLYGERAVAELAFQLLELE